MLGASAGKMFCLPTVRLVQRGVKGFQSSWVLRCENVWSVLGDSRLHYWAESQGRQPLCQRASGLIRSQLHYERRLFLKGSMNRISSRKDEAQLCAFMEQGFIKEDTGVHFKRSAVLESSTKRLVYEIQVINCVRLWNSVSCSGLFCLLSRAAELNRFLKYGINFIWMCNKIEFF